MPINVLHLLGERCPADVRTRRAVRNNLLARRSLAVTDYKAIRHQSETRLNEAAALRDQLRDNPKDEQKRRQCLALITEAVYLASDDEGRLVQWLRQKSIDLTGVTKHTALLPLALKAYGPYDYTGDARSCRLSDKRVSRDYNGIVRVLSPNTLPPDLVDKWNQPGCGIDVSSRPGEADAGKPNSGGAKRLTVAADAEMHQRATRDTDWTKMIWLVEGKGNKSKLQGIITDPSIVKSAISHIRHQLAARTKRRPTQS